MRQSLLAMLLFLLFVAILPCASTQQLHSNPKWPTSAEFLSVNQAVKVACELYPNVKQPLVWALIWEESKYDPLALGRKGEVGLGQLTPATAMKLGVEDRTNITESIRASVRHLSHLLAKYGNNTQLALSAYNSGEGAVSRCHCITAESQGYVNRVGQSSFFVERIAEYVQNTSVPSTTQDPRVSLQERQLVNVKATERSLPLIPAGLFILAFIIGITPGFRTHAILGSTRLTSWAVAAVEGFRGQTELEGH
jgi:hypothetical protein